MKKGSYLLVSILLMVGILTGCSGGKEAAVTQETEDQLKASIRAELEAEEQLKASIIAELEAEARQEDEKIPQSKENKIEQPTEINRGETTSSFDSNKLGEAVDIYDQAALFDFVKHEFRYDNYDDFDQNMLIYMYDVTGNGTAEAILVDHGSQMEPLIFVTVEQGQFEIIPSDLYSARYSGEVWLEDDFIMLRGAYGVSSEKNEALTIAYYNGAEVEYLEVLYLNYAAGYPNSFWAGDSTIDFIDGYQEFEYHYNLYINDEHTQDIRKHYKFNKEREEFIVTELPGGFDYVNNDKPVEPEKDENDPINNQDHEDPVDVSDKGYLNEEIKGQYIDYDEYKVVIYPWEYDGLNANRLANKKYSVGGKSSKMYVAIIGKVENLTAVQVIDDRFSKPKIKEQVLGEGTFRDVLLEIEYSSQGGIDTFVRVHLECDVRYPNDRFEHIKIGPFVTGQSDKKEPILYSE